MRSTSVLKFFLVASCVFPGHAIGSDANEGFARASLLSISNETKEEYLGRVLGQFRRLAGEDGLLTKSDAALQAKIAAASEKARVLSSLLANDLNNDGQVELVEIETVARTKGVTQPGEQMAAIDQDKDGIISDGEWLAKKLAPTRTGQARPTIQQMYLSLAVDPENGLGLEELKARAVLEFDGADSNQDGIVSADELKVWRENLTQKAGDTARSNDGVPPLPAMSGGRDVAKENAARRITQLRASSGPQRAVAQASNLTVLNDNGSNVDAGFRSGPKIGKVNGGVRRFNASIDGDLGSSTPLVSLERGSGFRILTETCSDQMRETRRCEIEVEMNAKVNGFLEDTLKIQVGKLSATASLRGESSGWPSENLVWEGLPVTMDYGRRSDKPWVITAVGKEVPQGIKSFRIKNIGEGASAPIELFPTDMTGQKKEGWIVDVDPTCKEGGLAPGGSCEVLVAPVPEIDGQSTVYLTLPGGAHMGVPRKTVQVISSVKGVAGKLPDGVIGNGDDCPAVGERAEIAVSGSGGFRSNDGYYSGEVGHASGAAGSVEVVTGECQAWQDAGDGSLNCVRVGAGGGHSSTMRKYQGKSNVGPWTTTELKPGHISLFVSCKDGKIETIDWTW